MIRSIDIKNFQSHKDTQIEFSSGVNIIVGKSDSGKSAILRSLRWVFYNRPSGDDFRSNWGGNTSVEVKFAEGVSVKRLKSSKKNGYYITKGDSTLELLALRTDVPEEVQKVINIKDLNLQKQLDSPFLLSSTSGQVAAYFNKIAHLEKIDEGTQKANSRIRKLNSKMEFISEELVEDKESLESYAYISEIEPLLKRLEKVEQLDVEKKEMIQKFEALLQEIDDIQVSLTKIEQTISLEKDVQEIEKLVVLSNTNKDKILQLSLLGQEIVAIQTRVKSVENKILLLPQIEEINQLISKQEKKKKQVESLTTILKEIKPKKRRIEAYSALSTLNSSVATILNLVKEKADIDKKVTSLSKNISEIETNLNQKEVVHRMLGQKQSIFKEVMGDTCPLCGQPIKTHRHEKE